MKTNFIQGVSSHNLIVILHEHRCQICEDSVITSIFFLMFKYFGELPHQRSVFISFQPHIPFFPTPLSSYPSHINDFLITIIPHVHTIT